MERISKTVFISYRRADFHCAVAVWLYLKQQGYDVFMDYFGLTGGAYEEVIFEQIKGHDHFVIVLSMTALERCSNPQDLMRREIEVGLESKRNIVSLMLPGFRFEDPAVAARLQESLIQLPKYNAISIPNEYFFESLDKLRKFLDIPLSAVVHPRSSYAQQIANQQNEASRGANPQSEVSAAGGGT